MSFSYQKILSMVLPLVISGFGQSIIYVTDILFLGRLGEVVLGASAIAGLFYASIMMVGFGISSGLQVIIAQKTGENNYQEVQAYLFNGIFLQIISALLFLIFYYISHHLLMKWFVSNPSVRAAADVFLSIRIIGILPYFLFYAYRSYYLGVGKTKIVSFVTIVMSGLNLLLNPILIYGIKDILPSFNYLGSAWASVISECTGALMIMVFYAYHQKRMRFISFIDYTFWKKILDTSLPLIFQHFISVFSWFLFFVFVEKMGTQALAVSNVIRAVYILIMSPILAFSHSTITIIGQLYGAMQYAQLKNTLIKIIILSLIFTLPFSLFTFFTPEWLMMIFTNDDGCIMNGRPVMQVISIALLCFAVSMPLLSAVTGLGDTKKSLWIESIAFVLYLSASVLFIFVWKLSLPLVWCNEFVYFISIALVSYLFFEYKRKRLLHIRI